MADGFEVERRLLESLDRLHKLEERGTVLDDASPPTVAMWTIRTTDEVGSLRMLADRLEATGATLIGMHSTGFGYPEETVIQVFVDLSTNWLDGEAG